MDWTGGRLQHIRKKGGLATAKQKAYFAKARSKLQTRVSACSPIRIFDPQGPKHHGFTGVSIQGQDCRQRQLEEYDSVAPVVHRLNTLRPRTPSAAPSRERHTDVSTRIPLRTVQSNSLLPEAFTERLQDSRIFRAGKDGAIAPHQETGQGRHRTKRQASTAALDLELKRRELLSRPDWRCGRPTKPPNFKFSSERKKDGVARRRQIAVSELRRLDFKKQYSKPIELSCRSDDQFNPTVNTDQISIRFGTGVHCTETDSCPSIQGGKVQQRPRHASSASDFVLLSHTSDSDTTGLMLLDEENVPLGGIDHAAAQKTQHAPPRVMQVSKSAIRNKCQRTEKYRQTQSTDVSYVHHDNSGNLTWSTRRSVHGTSPDASIIPSARMKTNADRPLFQPPLQAGEQVGCRTSQPDRPSPAWNLDTHARTSDDLERRFRAGRTPSGVYHSTARSDLRTPTDHQTPQSHLRRSCSAPKSCDSLAAQLGSSDISGRALARHEAPISCLNGPFKPVDRVCQPPVAVRRSDTHHPWKGHDAAERELLLTPKVISNGLDPYSIEDERLAHVCTARYARRSTVTDATHAAPYRGVTDSIAPSSQRITVAAEDTENENSSLIAQLSYAAAVTEEEAGKDDDAKKGMSQVASPNIQQELKDVVYMLVSPWSPSTERHQDPTISSPRTGPTCTGDTSPYKMIFHRPPRFIGARHLPNVMSIGQQLKVVDHVDHPSEGDYQESVGLFAATGNTLRWEDLPSEADSVQSS